MVSGEHALCCAVTAVLCLPAVSVSETVWVEPRARWLRPIRRQPTVPWLMAWNREDWRVPAAVDWRSATDVNIKHGR